MNKYTRKQYEAERQGIEQNLQATRGEIARLETLDATTVDNATAAHWNDMHDMEYEFEQQARAIESKWDTRSWTAGDWNTQALISSNID